MPVPLEICLEEELSEQDERYVRCVALPGGEPGLALDRDGVVRWMPAEPAAYGLWISADDRLMLLRSQGSAPITVRRGGRSLEAPEAKPVVLRDQDLLVVNGRPLRVHVHGIAHEVHAPERLSRSSLARMARTAAAAVVLSAAVALPAQLAQGALADVPPPIEVQPRPPAPPPMRQVVCVVSKMEPRKGSATLVHATCPAAHRLHVGANGHLVDAANKIVAGGSVIIRQIKGNGITADTPLQTPLKGTKAIFHVY
jgi:hypothetical protein